VKECRLAAFGAPWREEDAMSTRIALADPEDSP